MHTKDLHLLLDQQASRIESSRYKSNPGTSIGSEVMLRPDYHQTIEPGSGFRRGPVGIRNTSQLQGILCSLCDFRCFIMFFSTRF